MKALEYIFNDLDKMKAKYEDVYMSHLFYTAIDYYNDVEFVKKLLIYCINYGYTFYQPDSSKSTHILHIGFSEHSSVNVDYISNKDYGLTIQFKTDSNPDFSIEGLRLIFENITEYSLLDIVKPLVIKPPEMPSEKHSMYSYMLRQTTDGILKKYSYIGPSKKYSQHLKLFALKVLINNIEEPEKKVEVLRILTDFSINNCINYSVMYYITKWNASKNTEFITYIEDFSYSRISVLWDKTKDEFNVYNNLSPYQIFRDLQFVPKEYPDEFVIKYNKKIIEYDYEWGSKDIGGCALLSSNHGTIILSHHIIMPISIFVAINYMGYKLDMMLPGMASPEWVYWKKFNLGKNLFNRNTAIGTYNYFSEEDMDAK